ncbi:hypothetical protein ZIOFF_064965 [Zingiber officinale]|uniref:Cytoplasmic tRNA 2-thiolation protein 1 n=1 Tax=Zingiber officinale TaxID=94328 RepID=A0A8J5EWJ9_ZINOF|nr:hypothetical protein ZIOFF_064965 [Zingiber officinale]
MGDSDASSRSKRAAARLCSICNQRQAALKRPKTLQQICKECFYIVFEDEIHKVIMDNNLFRRGERVAVAASGGKDSTVLAYVMSQLNRRHNYGLDLFLLSVDEGITGYRDDSLETVKRNEIEKEGMEEKQMHWKNEALPLVANATAKISTSHLMLEPPEGYGLPLKVVSYKDLYGWTMDEIVKAIGLKNNCTFCGVFRRQALDRGAALMKADKIVTGHNADDIAETVLLNILRGDIARLNAEHFYFVSSILSADNECAGIYSPNAYRGFAREFIKDLERIRPRAILDIIRSGENFRIATSTKLPEQGTCERCGYISSQEFDLINSMIDRIANVELLIAESNLTGQAHSQETIVMENSILAVQGAESMAEKLCKACMLLEGLNRGLPKLGIGRTRGNNDLKKQREHGNSVPKITDSNLQSKQCGSLDF